MFLSYGADTWNRLHKTSFEDLSSVYTLNTRDAKLVTRPTEQILLWNDDIYRQYLTTYTAKAHTDLVAVTLTLELASLNSGNVSRLIIYKLL